MENRLEKGAADAASYDIVFSGQILPGADLAQVKTRLAALFKMDSDGVARLFSGKRFFIKKGVDGETAEKYKTALEKAGAACELVAHAAQASMSLAPRGATLVEFEPPAAPSIDISALDMLEVGRDVLDHYPEVASPAVDPQAFSVAPPGEILVDPPAKVEPPPPVTHFSIAEIGAPLMAEASLTSPAEPPRSDHLSLAPPGSPLGDGQGGPG